MTTIRVATASDFDRFYDLVQQAFNLPSGGRERGRTDFRPEQIRLAELDGTVVGTLRLFPFGHFFGGRAVPAGGVAAVSTAAEARGRGIGSEMVRAALSELRASGVPLSSLYPATVPIYMRAGYGFGGIRTTWKVALAELPARGSLAVEPFDEASIEDVDAGYRRIAEGSGGLLARDRDWWIRRVLQSHDDQPNYAYLVRESGRVTGHIVYRLDRRKDGWRFALSVRDLFWATPAAARTLLSLCAMHRSTAESMSWIGPPTEPVADLLPEDVVELDGRFRWMLRLVDVGGALEARGYPRHVEAELTLRARDPLFPENDGPWRVQVSGGTAKVTPAERADATADIHTWASLYAGLLSARDAVRLGALEATDAAIEALDAIFAGPLPWISDFF